MQTHYSFHIDKLKIIFTKKICDLIFIHFRVGTSKRSNRNSVGDHVQLIIASVFKCILN